MTRRNQNSIVLLTTLGVYLGLLVVGGAAPQIFAHSATSRFFDISEEQEMREDLDDNPADLACLTRADCSLQQYKSITAAVRAYFAVFAADFKDISTDISQDGQIFPTPCRINHKLTNNQDFSASDVRSQKLISGLNLARASI